ncbi:MAG: hypothetical protein ACOH2K_05140 [Burkholderiaceae bacterium]
MFQHNLTGQRFAAIFLLGWILLNYPLLALFNHAGTWYGIPILYAYLFIVWALIIGLLAYIAEKSSQPDNHADGEATATLTLKD